MSAAIALAVGLAAFFAAHLAIWRGVPSNEPRVLLLAGLGLGAMVTSGLVYFWIAGDAGAGLLAVVYTQTFLMLAYHYFYCGVSRSVSVTLLVGFLRFPSAPRPMRALVEEYSGSSRFEDRLALMEKSGFLALKGEDAVLRPKGLRLVRLSKFLVLRLGVSHEG